MLIKCFFIIGLAGLVVACGSHEKMKAPAYLPKEAVLTPAPSVALVLGGGGVRGYAHIGVLKVLTEAGVPIDLIAGASAGSIIAALYADSHDANYIMEKMVNTGFWDFADVSSPNEKGLISGEQLHHFLAKLLRARKFSQLKIKLVLATTDLNSGQVYPIAAGPIIPAVTASAALPGMLQPVSLYGHTLVDGGLSDMVPVDLAKRYRPQVIIAVNVTQPLPKEMPTTAVGVFERSQMIVYQSLARLSERGADIIIRPQADDVGTFSFSDKQRMIAAGEVAARQALPKIKKLLRAHGIVLKRTSK